MYRDEWIEGRASGTPRVKSHEWLSEPRLATTFANFVEDHTERIADEKMGLDARIGHIILPYSCRDMGVIVVYKRSRSWRGRASAGRKVKREHGIAVNRVIDAPPGRWHRTHGAGG